MDYSGKVPKNDVLFLCIVNNSITRIGKTAELALGGFVLY